MIDLLAQVQTRQRTGESCVAEDGFCPDYIVANFSDRYLGPFLEHIVLTLVPVAIGFVVAFGLALLAHRRGWLVGPFDGMTGFFYTIPSIALFILLLPFTGRGLVTGVFALVLYTLYIFFRNFLTGLQNVPPETKDAARGVGLTDRQLLWRVELPLAVPEILAGLRIATTTTVGLAALAVFAGAGGLGTVILRDTSFKSDVVTASALCIGLAVVLDLLILALQRAITPWRRAAHGR